MKRRTICALAAALAFAAVLLCHKALALREIPEGRVETIAWDLPAAERALKPLAEEWGWTVGREEDRLAILSESPFAAPAIRSALEGAGLEARVLDYSWAPAAAGQSGRLWLIGAAVLELCLLWRLLCARIRAEWVRARAALERQYAGEYLLENGVRLLAWIVALAAGMVATILALQWLWRAEPALPPELLPRDSVFEFAHYRQWTQNTFPEGLCSAFGRRLASQLRLCLALSAAEQAALAALTAALWGICKYYGQHERMEEGK